MMVAGYYGLDEVSSYWSSVIKLNNWQQTRISQIIVQNLLELSVEKNSNPWFCI